MKKLVQLTTYLLTVLVTLMPNFGFAGGSQGGGGGGVSCMLPAVLDGTNTAPYHTKIYLLEFWEAANGLAPFDKKITIPESDDPVDIQVRRAIKKVERVNPELGREILKAYIHINSPKVKFTVPNMRVRPPTDTVQPFMAENCSLIGLGEFFDGRPETHYKDDPLERLNYDASSISRANMSKTHEAGFWFHEAAYYVFRNFSDHKNSVVSRVLNVLAFSNEPIPSLATKPKGATKSFKCTSIDQGPKDDLISLYLHVVKGQTYLVPVSFIARSFDTGALFLFEKVLIECRRSKNWRDNFRSLGLQSDYADLWFTTETNQATCLRGEPSSSTFESESPVLQPQIMRHDGYNVISMPDKPIRCTAY